MDCRKLSTLHEDQAVSIKGTDCNNNHSLLLRAAWSEFPVSRRHATNMSDLKRLHDGARLPPSVQVG